MKHNFKTLLGKAFKITVLMVACLAIGLAVERLAQPPQASAASFTGIGTGQNYTSSGSLPPGVLFNTHNNFTTFSNYVAGSAAPVRVDTFGYRELAIFVSGKNQENVTNNVTFIFGGNNDLSTNYVTNLTWAPVFNGSNSGGAFTALISTNVPRYVYLLDIACSNNSSQFTNYSLTFFPK